MNHSPRLDQLSTRTFFPIIQQNFSTDIVIIGWWIAGISTLYYILKNTDRKVTLVEAYKIAHGATWHNAGQIIPYFEKPFIEIIQEYGISMANEGQKSLLDARERIQEIIETIDMKDSFEKFISYAGYSTIEQIIENLKKNSIQDIQHLQYESILVSKQCPHIEKIPSIYEDRIKIVEQEQINKLLQTKNQKFIGVLARHAGTINSALFCEKAIQYMIEHYHDRIQIYEFSPVEKIDIHKDIVKITTKTEKVRHLKDTPKMSYTGTVKAKKVILCTNGFENFTINNHEWQEINKDFHETIQGLVGYMSGYLDISGQSPLAISYYLKPGELETANNTENYFYLTRRQFITEDQRHSLICIGGPETKLDQKNKYMRHEAQPDRSNKQIDKFLEKTFIKYPWNPVKYQYRRHGLMGFTKSWLRIIWPDKKNDKLIYNIGCNWVWILSSIHGGWKISQFLLGKTQEASIFDPQ